MFEYVTRNLGPCQPESWWPLRLIVVGAGILGLAAAREFGLRHPDAEVLVLEKESKVAVHQTGRNSGVVHAGLYYAPGSLKARLCRRGVGLLEAFAAEHGVAYDRCGKLVVATDPVEATRLRSLENHARANGVPIEMLDAEGMREVEPHVRGLLAMHSPSSAITDYRAIAGALANEVRARGGSIRFGTWVRRICSTADGALVRTVGADAIAADHVVVCAGLRADRLARDSGHASTPRVVPFRGEYWQLRTDRRHLVRGLIYPVPDPALPFLGVHLTKRIDGEVLVGPNAVLALAREGYNWSTIAPRDLLEALCWGGTWRLFARQWRAGADELARSLSRRRFVAEARRYVPELRAEDVVRAGAGVRAQAVDADGSLVDDFRIEATRSTSWVRNAPSPAATSSLAIAEELVTRIDAQLRA